MFWLVLVLFLQLNVLTSCLEEYSGWDSKFTEELYPKQGVDTCDSWQAPDGLDPKGFANSLAKSLKILPYHIHEYEQSFNQVMMDMNTSIPEIVWTNVRECQMRELMPTIMNPQTCALVETLSDVVRNRTLNKCAIDPSVSELIPTKMFCVSNHVTSSLAKCLKKSNIYNGDEFKNLIKREAMAIFTLEFDKNINSQPKDLNSRVGSAVLRRDSVLQYINSSSEEHLLGGEIVKCLVSQTLDKFNMNKGVIQKQLEMEKQIKFLKEKLEALTTEIDTVSEHLTVILDPSDETGKTRNHHKNHGINKYRYKHHHDGSKKHSLDPLNEIWRLLRPIPSAARHHERHNGF